jgi:S1-C subfamily serine protease
VLDLEGGALKARAVTLQSLNQTRVVSAGGQAKLFPDRPAGDAMPVGTPAELFGKNDELIVRFANSDADVSAEFVRYARDQNVALLKVAAPALTPAVLAPDDNITIGARVVALGYSGAVHGPMLADGLVRSIPVDSTDPRQSNIQTSIQVGYGTSGGPVFDPQGRVIGIINFLARDGGQLMTYALPIRHGRTLLNPQSAR